MPGPGCQAQDATLTATRLRRVARGTAVSRPGVTGLLNSRAAARAAAWRVQCFFMFYSSAIATPVPPSGTPGKAAEADGSGVPPRDALTAWCS